MAKVKTMMTQEEFADWFGEYIAVKFEGNKSKAARFFKEEPNTIYEVLSCRRSPTGRILKKLKGGKETATHFYVGVE